MRALAALLLIAMLGVSGCSTTLFESLPTGASTGCDPAWPGRWQPVATEPGERQHPGSVEVSADCRTLTDNAKAKPLHRLSKVRLCKQRRWLPLPPHRLPKQRKQSQ